MRLDLDAESCSVKRSGPAFQAIDQSLCGNEIWRRGIYLAGSHPSFGLFIPGCRIKGEVLFVKLGDISAWSNTEDTIRRPYGHAHFLQESTFISTHSHVQWVDTQLLHFLQTFQRLLRNVE